MLAGNNTPQPIENQQRSHEVFEKKHYMEGTGTIQISGQHVKREESRM